MRDSKIVSDYLRKYNVWRRGDDERTMEEAGIVTAELGQMLDAAVGLLASGQGDAEAVANFEIECGCGDFYRANSFGGGFIAAAGMCENCAAMDIRPSSAGVPEGFVMAPVRLTAENGAKTALSGEFHEVVELECTACDGDDEECEVCSGSGSYTYRVPVSWTTIKDIYSAAISQFTAPQPPQEGEGDE